MVKGATLSLSSHPATKLQGCSAGGLVASSAAAGLGAERRGARSVAQRAEGEAFDLEEAHIRDACRTLFVDPVVDVHPLSAWHEVGAPCSTAGARTRVEDVGEHGSQARRGETGTRQLPQPRTTSVPAGSASGVCE